MRLRFPARHHSRWAAIAVAFAVAAALAATGGRPWAGEAPAAAAVTPAAAQPGPQVVPEPAVMTVGGGRFALTAGTRIVAVEGSPAALQAAPTASQF